MLGGEDDLVLAGLEEEGLQADEEEADGDAGEGERVGEPVGLPVHDEEAEEEEAKDHDCERAEYVKVGWVAVVMAQAVLEGKPCGCKQEPQSDREFNDRVAPWDSCPAIAAATAQDEPADHG